jgi:hypothetical protein
MVMKRSKTKERFVGIPHWVMHHASFRAASHRARALLLDVLLQYTGSNNGKLVVCDKALKPLGWNSRDGLCKAKQELLALGLLVETRRGARPNKAAWFALGWRALDIVDGFDINPRSYVPLAARKIEALCPHGGLEPTSIRPPHGQRAAPPRPPHGRMRPDLAPRLDRHTDGIYVCHTKGSTEGGEHG